MQSSTFLMSFHEDTEASRTAPIASLTFVKGPTWKVNVYSIVSIYGKNLANHLTV